MFHFTTNKSKRLAAGLCLAHAINAAIIPRHDGHEGILDGVGTASLSSQSMPMVRTAPPAAPSRGGSSSNAVFVTVTDYTTLLPLAPAISAPGSLGTGTGPQISSGLSPKPPSPPFANPSVPASRPVGSDYGNISVPSTLLTTLSTAPSPSITLGGSDPPIQSASSGPDASLPNSLSSTAVVIVPTTMLATKTILPRTPSYPDGLNPATIPSHEKRNHESSSQESEGQRDVKYDPMFRSPIMPPLIRRHESVLNKQGDES